MAKTMANIISAFVLLYILSGLVFGIYVGMEEHYGVVPDDVDGSGKTIMEKISSEITLIKGVENLRDGISSLKSLSLASINDLVGGTFLAGIGIAQIIGGMVILPLQIFEIVTDFYIIPEPIEFLIGIALTITIGFILLGGYLRHKLEA